MPRKVWTDEMKAVAAGMKRAGISNTTIAERLGVTPASISNKIFRLGAHATLIKRGKKSKTPRLTNHLFFNQGEE